LFGPCGSNCLLWSWSASGPPTFAPSSSRVTGRLRRCQAGVRVVGPSRASPLESVPHHGSCGVPSQPGTPTQQAAAGRGLRACPLIWRRLLRAVLPRCAGRSVCRFSAAHPPGLQPGRTPLLGLSKDHPSVDISLARPLPALVPRKRVASTFGLGLPPPRRVPSLPFLPASTVSSAQYLAGLLHPAANHGVRHVSGFVAVVSPARDLTRFGLVLPPARRVSGHSPSPFRIEIPMGLDCPTRPPSPGCLRRSPSEHSLGQSVGVSTWMSLVQRAAARSHAAGKPAAASRRGLRPSASPSS
jgi:hypothetical protein